MNIHILTLFPKVFEPILDESIIMRAQKKGLVKIKVYDLRDWATDKHGTVDDKAYGGGAGMILKVDVIDRALHDLKCKVKSACLAGLRLRGHSDSRSGRAKCKVVITDPKGKKFEQKLTKKYSKLDDLIIICGHYGGVDERVLKIVDDAVSIGDFVLTGGEIPAMAIVDAVTRLVPGAIKKESLESETHTKIGYKQYPQYTRPENYKPKSIPSKKSLTVPNMLLSGNHAEIEKWKKSY